MQETNRQDMRINIDRESRFDPLTRRHFRNSLEKIAYLHDRKYGPQALKELKVHIEETNSDGRASNYTFNAVAFTDNGRFAATKKSWYPAEGMKQLTEALKEQLIPQIDHLNPVQRRR